ncbi:hypothetical protein J437_LFUL005231 [Ladona fulva]|uniref:Uncharacterized protein n=1 Tax=Ladona fulva TaxID=123851 RepID=A0A8K0KGI4_LADFU|nr:hypothetical protein J437_LFUL005231 [Ladona fulva]
MCLTTPDGPVCGCRDGYTRSGALETSLCEVEKNYTRPSRCSHGFFQCAKNLHCIDARFVCDGDEDCSDGSDEDSSPGGICETVSCNQNQFHCDGDRCISNQWVCDGDIDCTDGSDEAPSYCHSNGSSVAPTCFSTQFRCEISGRCIPHSWTCDSDLDCGEGDNSDEHADCGK